MTTKCTHCGGSNFLFARDLTEYSPCELDEDGKWSKQYTDTQESRANDALSFFCRDCGTPHPVPDELKGD